MSDDRATPDESSQDTKSSAAEERAKKAEAEARKLKAEAKKREDDERRAKMEQDLKDTETAKQAAIEYEKRAAQAEKEAAELRDMLKRQTEAKLEQLPEDARDRVKKYQDKLSMGDFDLFVSEELTRVGQRDSSDGSTVNPPPPAATGEVTRLRDTRGEGRRLEPRTMDILDRLGVDERAARTMLTVERDGANAKFVLPPKRMIQFVKERATAPTLLNPETYERLTKTR